MYDPVATMSLIVTCTVTDCPNHLGIDCNVTYVTSLKFHEKLKRIDCMMHLDIDCLNQMDDGSFHNFGCSLFELIVCISPVMLLSRVFSSTGVNE